MNTTRTTQRSLFSGTIGFTLWLGLTPALHAQPAHEVRACSARFGGPCEADTSPIPPTPADPLNATVADSEGTCISSPYANRFSVQGDVAAGRPLAFSGTVSASLCAEAGTEVEGNVGIEYSFTDEFVTFIRTDQAGTNCDTVQVRLNTEYRFAGSADVGQPKNPTTSNFGRIGFFLRVWLWSSSTGDNLVAEAGTDFQGTSLEIDTGWVASSTPFVDVPLNMPIAMDVSATVTSVNFYDTCASCQGIGHMEASGTVQLRLAAQPFTFQGPGTYTASAPRLLIVDNASNDCNHDGIPDDAQLAANDCNTNGLHDACDVIRTPTADCNDNGIPDECDIAAGTSADCNANGTPDTCDVTSSASADCSGNGILDECELSAGTSADCNANDVPDACDLVDTNARPAFIRIGDLPGGIYSSRLNTISTDATTATGFSDSANGQEMIRWTEATGLEGLGDLPGCGFFSNGLYVSADGSTIAAYGQSTASCCGGCNPGGADREPARWTESDGLVPLGDLCGGGFWGQVQAGSEDGSVLVGTSQGTVDNQLPTAHAFAWTAATGMRPLPTGPVQSNSSTAEGFCGHGPVIVGSMRPGSGVPNLPVYWPSVDSHPVIINDLPGGTESGAFRGCSHDAAVIVGWGTSASGPEAAYWTSQTGLVGLGDLPGGSFNSRADEVTPDGGIIVGFGTSAIGQEAVVWDESRTLHRAADYLAQRGVVIPAGWRLTQVRAIAVNGNVVTLAGVATNECGNTEGWVSRHLRAGSSLDCNANSAPDSCDIGSATSLDANANGTPDECEVGVPAATIIGAISRKNCDLTLLPAGRSDSRQSRVTEIRIAMNVPPGAPGLSAFTLEEATCAAPAFVPYTGASAGSAAAIGNELVLMFSPGLENGRTYRATLGPDVTNLPGQFVEVRGLIGDVNSDGSVNAIDRSIVVGAWTGTCFNCATDVNSDDATNALDRSIVVGAWTGGQTCAP